MSGEKINHNSPEVYDFGYNNFTVLDPRRTPEAEEANSKIFENGNVFGVEVTIPALAARCDLGNLDPQHTSGDAQTAAIEAALTCELPNPEATLVTIRADVDSVGAMAVLALRRTGYEPLQTDFYDRINIIASADKERITPWPGVRPIREPEDFVGPASSIGAVVTNHNIPLRDRVETMMDWLTTGTFEGAEQFQEKLVADAKEALNNLEVEVRHGIAVVTGNSRLAMSLGYHYSPIVVATNPSFSFQGGKPQRKHTVARWNSTVPVDWDAVRDELSQNEPGWGGSPIILGSPQGERSKLSTKKVLSCVMNSLRPIDAEEATAIRKQLQEESERYADECAEPYSFDWVQEANGHYRWAYEQAEVAAVANGCRFPNGLK